MISEPEWARLWSRIGLDDEQGCWPWLLAPQNTKTMPSGYGRFWLRDGSQPLAHRLVYELVVGPIPPGLTLDHLCRNTMCVNPWHMEPVTSAENVLRGEGAPAQNARKTHCKQGHPLPDIPPPRRCRICEKDYFARRYQAQKAQRNASHRTH